jgi:DNA-binding NarL/FixJ family response regulator
MLLEEAGAGSIIAACDMISGYQAFLQHKPDVVIVDLSLKGEELGGLILIERIRSHDPNARVLVFSMHAEYNIFASAIEAGATGYLLKESHVDELPKAVQQVSSGHSYIDARLVHKLVFPGSELSLREKNVLALLMERTRYASIAGQMGIKPKEKH